jgi:hypothetical protein
VAGQLPRNTVGTFEAAAAAAYYCCQKTYGDSVARWQKESYSQRWCREEMFKDPSNGSICVWQ